MRRIKRIIETLLGRKYYAVIVNRRGTANYELSCFIFMSRQEVKEYKLSLSTNRSYEYIETVSFRTHTDYEKVEDDALKK